MTSPPIPQWIVMNPDHARDRWQFSLFGPAYGFFCGDIDLPASADYDQIRQAAEARLTELSRDLFHADLAITWHPPAPDGRTGGDIHPAARTA
jgi:hypothetical protein